MNDPGWHPFDYQLQLQLGEFRVMQFSLSVERRVFSLPEILGGAVPAKMPDLPKCSAGYFLVDIPEPCVQRSIAKTKHWLHYCLQSYQRSFIDMSGDFAAYQMKFSGKTRSGIRRKVNKLANHVQRLDLRCYRTPAEIGDFFELAGPVSAASYQERLLDCGLPRDSEFIKRAVSKASQNDIRAFVLLADGLPVSYLYCPVYDGVLQYAHLGYLPDFSRFSPGTVLQWLALEQLFGEQRFKAFDFTGGDSEHKRFFATHQVPCSLQLILRPTWKHRMLLWVHRTTDVGSVLLVDILDRLGVKRRLKRWVRRAA